MAFPNLQTIRAAIRTMLLADARFQPPNCVVEVETRGKNSLNTAALVAIYSERMEPDDQMPLAKGRYQGYTVIMQVVVASAHRSGDLPAAVAERDGLIAAVTEVLQADRTLGQTVESSWAGAVELGLDDSNGFTSLGVVEWRCKVKAII